MPSNTNLTHTVILRPLSYGLYNISWARISYTSSDGEQETVCFECNYYQTPEVQSMYRRVGVIPFLHVERGIESEYETIVYCIAGNIGSLQIWQFGPKPTVKILAEFKFGGGVLGSFIKERCRLSLEILEQNHEFAI